MSTISDLIEQFIISVFGDDETIQLSRNELASYFNVAPSQINYVLSTRFGTDKGYIIESKRGGGGGITIVRMLVGEDELLPNILNSLEETKDLTYNKAEEIIERLVYENIINHQESEIIKCAISDKALATPIGKANIRKNIFREIIIGLIRRQQNE